MKLKDKICLITGAASGIGKEIALTFAREGGKIVIADLNRDAAHATAAQIAATGASAMGIVMNVVDEEQVNAGVDEVVRANVICPGFVRTPLVDKQIPEQAKALGISEADVIRNVMLKDTVDGEFTTTRDVAMVALLFRAFRPTR